MNGSGGRRRCFRPRTFFRAARAGLNAQATGNGPARVQRHAWPLWPRYRHLPARLPCHHCRSAPGVAFPFLGASRGVIPSLHFSKRPGNELSFRFLRILRYAPLFRCFRLWPWQRPFTFATPAIRPGTTRSPLCVSPSPPFGSRRSLRHKKEIATEKANDNR